MRQIWITRAGAPEVLQVKEAADPAPNAGEVRIRVEASGVNFADIMGRMGVYPDLPPIPVVPGYEVSAWFGFFAPAKTPKPVVDLLNRAINRALQSPDVAEKLAKVGMDPVSSTPEVFAAMVASDYAKWGPIVKASGFKPE